MYILNFDEIFSENVLYLNKKYDYQIITDLKNFIENYFLEKDKSKGANGDIPRNPIHILVFGSHKNPHQLIEIKKNHSHLHFIIIQTEQYNSDVFNNKFYIQLLKENRVLCWSNYLSNKLIRNFESNIVGLFEFPFFKILNDTKVKKDIDILFIGSRNDERQKIESILKKKYPNKMIMFDYQYSFTNMEKLTNILLRTKIVLNIPYYTDSVLETHRINKALNCNCNVISYYSNDEDLNQKYKNYIHFTNDIVKYIEKTNFLEYCKKKEIYKNDYNLLFF
jgi:hypothetical protein